MNRDDLKWMFWRLFFAWVALVLCARFLSGCVLRPTANDAEVQAEIDNVVCVYEALYEELTPEEITCVYNVEVHFTNGRVPREECDLGRGTRGCTIGRNGDSDIYISRAVPRPTEIFLLRHELVHHLLFCTHQRDRNHEHPAFAGSSSASAPGSLARMAPTVAECR